MYSTSQVTFRCSVWLVAAMTWRSIEYDPRLGEESSIIQKKRGYSLSMFLTSVSSSPFLSGACEDSSQPLVVGQGHMNCFGQWEVSRSDPSLPVSCLEELVWASLCSLCPGYKACGHLCWYGGALTRKLPEILTQYLEDSCPT